MPENCSDLCGLISKHPLLFLSTLSIILQHFVLYVEGGNWTMSFLLIQTLNSTVTLRTMVIYVKLAHKI